MAYLITRTISAEGGHDRDFTFALVSLDAAAATGLLALRAEYDRVKAAAAAVCPLYCLEFWDDLADYGRGFREGWVAELYDERELTWAAVERVAPGLRQPGRTLCHTLRVMSDGVSWQAMPKHAGGEFETQALDWSVIEAIAEGRQPLPELARPADWEDEDGDDDEPGGVDDGDVGDD